MFIYLNSMERDRFKKLFPHLAEEMESGKSKVHLDEDSETGVSGTRTNARKWVGYNPDVVDFIRRCETVEQAKEVIEYLESRGEITAERTGEVKKQLAEGGLRSFGAKKDKGFYHKDR
jgi:hypothetical protein